MSGKSRRFSVHASPHTIHHAVVVAKAGKVSRIPEHRRDVVRIYILALFFLLAGYALVAIFKPAAF